MPTKHRPQPPQLVPLPLKLDAAVLARVEAERVRLSTPYRQATQADALRALAVIGIDVVEARAARKGEA